jgi:hypothetical protein
METGWFSDDHQYFLMLYTKASLGIFSFIDLITFRPGSGGHIAPVTNILNYALLVISKEPKLIRFIIYLAYVLSGFVLYKIIVLTHKEKLVAFLAAVVFISSFDLSIKSIVWLTFHYNTTNTLTGLVSLLFLVKYFMHGNYRHLAVFSIFLLLTFFNYETGLVFFIVAGVVILHVGRYVSGRAASQVMVALGALIFVTTIYGGSAIMISGTIAPVFLDRLSSKDGDEHRQASIEERSESNIQDLDKINPTTSFTTNQAVDNLSIGRLRSTYAPRTPLVASLRMVDILMDTLNLSFAEKMLREYFLSELEKDIKEKVVKKYSKLIQTLGIPLAVMSIVGLIIFSIHVYLTIGQDTRYFLYLFLATTLIFVLIFNRIDIANSLAIFSSVVIASLAVKGWRSSSRWRQIVSVIPILLVLFGSAVNMLTHFDYIYPFDKTLMNNHGKLTNLINEGIGGYNENVFLFVQEGSSYRHPGMNDLTFINDIDLSHSNIWHYRQEFVSDPRLVRFRHTSIGEFMGASQLADNIKIKIVKKRPTIERGSNTEKYLFLYLDGRDQLFRL